MTLNWNIKCCLTSLWLMISISMVQCTVSPEEQQVLRDIAICIMTQKADVSQISNYFNEMTPNIDYNSLDLSDDLNNVMSREDILNKYHSNKPDPSIHLDEESYWFNRHITQSKNQNEFNLNDLMLQDGWEYKYYKLNSESLKLKDDGLFSMKLKKDILLYEPDPMALRLNELKRDLFQNKPRVQYVDGTKGSSYIDGFKMKEYNDINKYFEEEAKKQAKIQAKEKLTKKFVDQFKQRLKDGGKLGPKQAQFLKQQRLLAVKSKLLSGVKLSVGFSVVLNVDLLFKGEILQYIGKVGTDVTIGTVTTGLGITLEEVGLEELAPGAGIVVFGIIDAVKASQTGDWSRFGLNIGLNTCATIGALGGGKLGGEAGAVIGTFIGGPPGTAIGATIGGIVGAIGGGLGLRLLGGQTPLGQMTDQEKQKYVEQLAEKLNPQFDEFGFELDTSVSWDELQEKLKKGDYPLKVKKELVNVNVKDTIDFEGIKDLLGNDLTDTILDISPLLGQKTRVEGLKALKEALGC